MHREVYTTIFGLGSFYFICTHWLTSFSFCIFCSFLLQ